MRGFDSKSLFCQPRAFDGHFKICVAITVVAIFPVCHYLFYLKNLVQVIHIGNFFVSRIMRRFIVLDRGHVDASVVTTNICLRWNACFNFCIMFGQKGGI